MSTLIAPLPLANIEQWETRAVLKKTAEAHRYLAELKGVAASIPNEAILINTLALQEAKDSSEVENIVTTHDELYKASLFEEAITNPATKEVQDYAFALKQGFQRARQSKLIRLSDILAIQQNLEHNTAGLRKLPGTDLKNARTGKWEPWLLFMLDGIINTAQNTISLITEMKTLMANVKHGIREQLPKLYSQDLLNNLFNHPYTKIDFIVQELGVTRITATKYLEQLVKHDFLVKQKVGRANYYINQPLCQLLIAHS